MALLATVEVPVFIGGRGSSSVLALVVLIQMSMFERVADRYGGRL